MSLRSKELNYGETEMFVLTFDAIRENVTRLSKLCGGSFFPYLRLFLFIYKAGVTLDNLLHIYSTFYVLEILS